MTITETKKEFGIGILRGNLFWLTLCQCIWSFTTNIPTSYVPLYIQQLGGSPADVGYVRSIAALAGLFLYPLGGYIADKSGRVKLVNWATLGYASSFIPYALAQNWQTVAFAAFWQSFVLFYMPILTVLMADSMPAGQRAAGFGLAISIPQAIGIFAPSVGGYLVDKMGLIPAMRMIYQIGLAAGILVFFIRRATLKETLDPAKAEKIDWKNLPKVFRDSYSNFFQTVRWLPDPLIAIAVMQVTQMFFNGLAGSMWIIYATAIIGVTATQWGLTSAVQGVTNLAIAYNAGMLMDKYGRRRFLIPFTFIVPLFPLAFIFLIKDWWGLAGLAIVMAFTNAFLMSGFQSLLSDWTPRERRGRVTSTVGTGSFYVDIRGTQGGGGMLLFIPLSIGQALGGILYMQSPTYPFIVCSFGMAFVAIWAYLKVRDPKEIEK